MNAGQVHEAHDAHAIAVPVMRGCAGRARRKIPIPGQIDHADARAALRADQALKSLQAPFEVASHGTAPTTGERVPCFGASGFARLAFALRLRVRPETPALRVVCT